MVVVPTLTLFTAPVEALMVAIEGLLLLHTPPGVRSLKEVVLLKHTVVAPVMGDIVGRGLIVAFVVPTPLVHPFTVTVNV